jgi:hypothetical protein
LLLWGTRDVLYTRETIMKDIWAAEKLYALVDSSVIKCMPTKAHNKTFCTIWILHNVIIAWWSHHVHTLQGALKQKYYNERMRKLTPFFIVFVRSLRLSLCLFVHERFCEIFKATLFEGKRVREETFGLKHALRFSIVAPRLQIRPTDVSRGRTRAITHSWRSLAARIRREMHKNNTKGKREPGF